MPAPKAFQCRTRGVLSPRGTEKSSKPAPGFSFVTEGLCRGAFFVAGLEFQKVRRVF